MVKFLAKQLANKCSANIDYNDLYSAGVEGLIKAVDNFDPKKGASLKTYANWRIKGQMYDFLRKQLPIGRHILDEQKILFKTLKQLTAELNRMPSTLEVCKKLNWSLEEYHAFIDKTKNIQLNSFEIGLHDRPYAIDYVEKLINCDYVMNLINTPGLLTSRQWEYLILYFFKDMTFKQIGKIFNRTESHACYIVNVALKILKDKASCL